MEIFKPRQEIPYNYLHAKRKNGLEKHKLGNYLQKPFLTFKFYVKLLKSRLAVLALKKNFELKLACNSPQGPQSSEIVQRYRMYASLLRDRKLDCGRQSVPLLIKFTCPYSDLWEQYHLQCTTYWIYKQMPCVNCFQMYEIRQKEKNISFFLSLNSKRRFLWLLIACL